MSWYRTGTVSVTNGSPDLVFVGTLLLSQASVGDIFIGPDLALYELTAIADDLNASVKKLDGTAAYGGSTLSAQDYAIIRNFTSTLPAQLAADLADLIAKFHVTMDEMVAWLSGTGTVTVHDAVGNAYSVKTPAQLAAEWTGRLAKSVAGGADVALTSAEAGNRIIELTGTLTGSINVTVPVATRSWIVKNGTTGAYTVTFKGVTGTGVIVPQGGIVELHCDGTNVVMSMNSIVVGSDADGDMWYRANNIIARLAKGAANLKLYMNAAGDAPEWAQGIKIITGARSLAAAAGDVSYTGVGFKPSAIIVIGTISGTIGASWGVDDGATPWSFYRDIATGNFYTYPGDSFSSYSAAGPDGQHGHVASFDADGFTVSWTKQNAPSGTFAFAVLCFR